MSIPMGGYGGSEANVPTGKLDYSWIGQSFEMFKANAGTWILTVLVSAVLPVVIVFMLAFAMGLSGRLIAPPTPGSTPGSDLPISFQIVTNLFSILYQSFFYGGVYGMAVKQVRGQSIGVGDLLDGSRTMLKFLGFFLLTTLLGAGGGALLFPLIAHVGATGAGLGGGAIAAILVFFVLFLVAAALLLPVFAMLADGMGVFQAIGRSVQAMKGSVGSAIGLLFVMGLLVLVSELPCLLGLFVTLPMTWLISALAYRDMGGMTGLAAPFSPDYGQPQEGIWPPPPSTGQTPPGSVWPPPPSA